jgi:hypothetical protein
MDNLLLTPASTKLPDPEVTGIPVLLPPRETAAVLHTSVGCLAVWRCTRRHPLRYIRVGRKIFYTPEGIREFLNSRVDPGNGPKPEKFHKRRRARKSY